MDDVYAGVHAEAIADLDRLQAAMDQKVARLGADHAAVEFTQELIDQSTWDRVMLASVLSAALARPARAGAVTALIVHVGGDSPDSVDVEIDGEPHELPAALFGNPKKLGGRFLLTAEENRNA